jgi:hypothetical protein
MNSLNEQFIADLGQPTQPRNEQERLATVFAATINTQINMICGMGVPPLKAVDILLEFCGMILARIDPASTREAIINNIKKNFPAVVERHYTLQHRTSGGVILP